MASAKKKRNRKIKFYKVELKIPEALHKQVRKYCKKNKITPNKFHRRAIREYIELHARYAEHAESQVGNNQMSIFDIIENTKSEKS